MINYCLTVLTTDIRDQLTTDENGVSALVGTRNSRQIMSYLKCTRFNHLLTILNLFVTLNIVLAQCYLLTFI